MAMPTKFCRACGVRSDHYTRDCPEREEETLYAVAPVRYSEPMTPDERDDEFTAAEWYAEAEMARWDDDPSPYDGTYPED